MSKQRTATLKLAYIGMFTAIIAILTQFTIPLPSGIPITLQTFAVVLCGYVLGWKRGILTMVCYLLLGAVGVPVFSGFTGGFGKLVGITGGFLWGFLLLVLFTGFASQLKKRPFIIGLGIIGLLLCHLSGCLQYMVLSSNTLWQSALITSVPFLLKDVISVIIAYLLSIPIRRILPVF